MSFETPGRHLGASSCSPCWRLARCSPPPRHGPQAVANVGWLGFGNTPDELRHSPLTQITPHNVDQLGRLFTVDFRQIDPSIRRGEQSYPVESNGTLYVTTNDDNVFALNATTGAVKWRWQPDNVAVFRNFGIVANRGVALCDGHVFLLTLDMTIVSLDPATGQLEQRVPIAKAVPGASSSYGYSETSAPICANHRLIVGAAGSEYGVRGFVMAYHTDLTPAWPNPFWTIPPGGHVVAALRHARRRRRRLDADDRSTRRRTRSTSAPARRRRSTSRRSAPGSNPRADSLVAVDLASGRLKWWQQQMAHNEWAYDTAQPPMVYTGEDRRQEARIVSVATMEGVWFAYDAATGRPIYQRVKVIDRTEHPTLQPGQAGRRSSRRRSAASTTRRRRTTRTTNYVFNAAAETAAVAVQAKLTPTQKRRKRLLGDVFLGLQNGNFGTVAARLARPRLDQRDRHATGRRVWKVRTPEPERGGVTTTASGLGFAGGGDGVFRAFDLKTGKVLWTFQTGHQFAAGRVGLLGRRQGVRRDHLGRHADVVGRRTATRAAGVRARRLAEAVAAAGAAASGRGAGEPRRRSRRAPRPRAAVAHGAHACGRRRRARIVTQPAIAVQSMGRRTRRTSDDVTGRLLLNGRPRGARAHQRRRLRRPPGDRRGRRLPLRRGRHARAQAPGAGRGRGAGNRRRPQLTDGRAERAARAPPAASASATRIDGLHATKRSDGTIVDHRPRARRGGHRAAAGRAPDLPAHGHDHGRGREARAERRRDHAHPGPRLLDVLVGERRERPLLLVLRRLRRDVGRPGPLAVGVAYGGTSYGGTSARTRRSTGCIRARWTSNSAAAASTRSQSRPRTRARSTRASSSASPARAGSSSRVANRWPDAKGRFTIVLPASARGKTVRFWENQRQFFTRSPATPGGPVDLSTWPSQLGTVAPAGLASLTLPRFDGSTAGGEPVPR